MKVSRSKKISLMVAAVAIFILLRLMGEYYFRYPTMIIIAIVVLIIIVYIIVFFKEIFMKRK